MWPTPLPHSALETRLREQRARVSKNSETGKGHRLEPQTPGYAHISAQQVLCLASGRGHASGLANRLRSASSLSPASWAVAAAGTATRWLDYGLQSLLNLASYSDFILVIAWLLAALRPTVPTRSLRLRANRAPPKPSPASFSRR
jgi:hypothetical protein